MCLIIYKHICELCSTKHDVYFIGREKQYEQTIGNCIELISLTLLFRTIGKRYELRVECEWNRNGIVFLLVKHKISWITWNISITNVVISSINIDIFSHLIIFFNSDGISSGSLPATIENTQLIHVDYTVNSLSAHSQNHLRS